MQRLWELPDFFCTNQSENTKQISLNFQEDFKKWHKYTFFSPCFAAWIYSNCSEERPWNFTLGNIPTLILSKWTRGFYRFFPPSPQSQLSRTPVTFLSIVANAKEIGGNFRKANSPWRCQFFMATWIKREYILRFEPTQTSGDARLELSTVLFSGKIRIMREQQFTFPIQ